MKLYDTDFAKAERILGYHFKDRQLLISVFTDVKDNQLDYFHKQELSFFGDSLIHFITTEFLIKYFRHGSLEEIAELRKAIVSNNHLRFVYNFDGLDQLFNMFKGSCKNELNSKSAGNCLEGILAAIYFDGGIDPAMVFAKKFIFKSVPFIYMKDYTTEMNLFIQKYRKSK
jgi:ribonuclease III